MTMSAVREWTKPLLGLAREQIEPLWEQLETVMDQIRVTRLPLGFIQEAVDKGKGVLIGN
jgi:hypothetical protein